MLEIQLKFVRLKLGCWWEDCWACLIDHSSWWCISLVLIGPVILFIAWFLQLWMNRLTHTPIRRAFGKAWLLSTWSKASFLGMTMERISRLTLTSAMVSAVGFSVMTGGQFEGALSQSGLCFQRWLFTASPPRLLRSAGLSSVGTWCHLTCLSCWILCTLF